MDFYWIAGSVIILVVVVAVITGIRRYQKVRVEEGYHAGKFYRLGQHTGAFAGNYQMNKLGVDQDGSDNRVETDEEMYLFSESDKK